MKQHHATRSRKFYRARQMISYFVFYFIVFFLLEHRDVAHYMLDGRIDEYIPFVPAFIVPYLSWFAFLPATIIYFVFFQDDDEQYARLSKTIFFGDTVFLLISLVFPNGQGLRPALEGGGVFTQLVQFMYSIDTPTNVLPSLHVFNGVACCLALINAPKFRERRRFCRGVEIWTVLIVLSTMLVKQHTVLDVVTALTMNSLCYNMLYREHTAMHRVQRRERRRIMLRERNW